MERPRCWSRPLGFGHAVVGAPSVYFGRYVRDSPAFLDESDRRAALQRWGDTLESLDSAVFDALAGARGPLHVDMLMGDADPRHPETTEALAQICSRTPAVTLRTTIAPRVDYSTLVRPFGRYLTERVLDVVAADATALRRGAPQCCTTWRWRRRRSGPPASGNGRSPWP